MTKTIMITGAGGYIGSKMVIHFLDLGYKIIALDRFFFGDVFSDLKYNKRLKVVKADIRSFQKDLLKNVSIVIDLASLSNDASSSLNPKITTEINYKGAVRVATLSKEMNVEKYIFASSCSVYGKAAELVDEMSDLSPATEYARSKMMAEKGILRLADSNFCTTILRNATVFGLSSRRMRFDLMVNLMTLTAWENNKIFIYGGGKQWRPLIHIDDCIDAFIAIMKEKDMSKVNRQIFNVGSNSLNYQVIQVAQMFKKNFSSLKIENVPSDAETRDYRVDFGKIERVLGYSTKKTIDQGIIEIRKSLDDGEVVGDLRTHTLNYYKYLMESEKLINGLKIDGKMFL